MNITVTLLGQMVTFILFVWFTKRFVWPPVIKALKNRQALIAEGLAAAERGHHDLVLAQESAVKQLKQAKAESASIVEDAKRQAGQIIDGAKSQAREEGARLVAQASNEIEMMVAKAKEDLRQQVGMLAVLSAEKILGQSINDASHNQMIDNLIKEL